jgi:hypothetical protein
MIHIYIFTFLLLLIFIVVFAFIFKKKDVNESFTSIKLTDQNLLHNSSFEDGKNIKEFQEKSGTADIIVFPNPGASKYVLRQSKNKNLDNRKEIFYEIKLDVKPNKIYCLRCLYYSTNDIPLVYRLQYNKTYENPIFLKTMNEEKKTDKFKNQYCLFQTPNNDNTENTTELFISLMYNFNNIKGYNYLTDVVLEEIIDGYNIPITSNLRCYLNAFHPKSVESSNKVIKDISGNDFSFSASRNVGVQKMDVDLTNNILTGPNAFQLQNQDRMKYNNKFSLFLFIKGEGKQISESFTNQGANRGNIPAEEEESNEVPIGRELLGVTILKISGNQNTALEVILPQKYGNIYLIAGGEKYKTDIQYLSSMENMLAISYNGDKIFMYINGELVLESRCPKIYFDNSPVIINPKGAFLGSFYTFAYYNENQSGENIGKITKYFTKMKAIGNELSNQYIDNNMDDFIITNHPGMYAKKMEGGGEDKEEDNKNLTCPKVIYENDHYYILISHNSKLAKDIGYSGIRDYGGDIETAKKIFEINFPKCKLPDMLDKTKYRADLSECPFVMLTPDNPCNQFECRKTDWNNGVPNNNYCKRSVDVYCSKYSDVDSACYCWKKENKDKSECMKWRGNFEAEDKCDFRKFDIEKHPDSKDYIKKSKIPCWGCNLDAPESTGAYLERKGSGAR